MGGTHLPGLYNIAAPHIGLLFLWFVLCKKRVQTGPPFFRMQYNSEGGASIVSPIATHTKKGNAFCYRGRAEYKGRPLYLACQIGKNGPKSPLPRGGFFRRRVRTRGRNPRFSAFPKSVRQVVGSFRKNGPIFRCLNFPPFLALTHSFTRFHSVCTHFQAMFDLKSQFIRAPDSCTGVSDPREAIRELRVGSEAAQYAHSICNRKSVPLYTYW